MKISDSFYPARESQEGNVQAIFHKVNGVTYWYIFGNKVIADYYMKICSSFLGKFDFPSFALMNAGNFSGWPTHHGQLN